MSGLKAVIRDLLPPGLQVPVKYGFDRLRHLLEPEMALLPDLVSSGDRVIDVGGNRGTYAYRLHGLGAKVEVFEPNPVCLRVLKSWAAGRARVSVHPVGLSASEGSADLAIPVDEHGVEHDASASIEHGAAGGGRIETIPIRTLDSFGFRDPALIKIDVEGHEESVIDGARETIAASAPALLIEIEQRHLSKPIGTVLGKIVSLGYEGFFLVDGKLRPISEFDVVRHQSQDHFGTPGGGYFNNFLFLHTSKLAEGKYAKLLGR